MFHPDRPHYHPDLIGKPVAEILQKLGWCQRQYQDDSGAVCLLGALAVKAIGDARYGEPDPLAINKILSVIRSPWISYWNDRPERTKAQVIAVAQKAGV